MTSNTPNLTPGLELLSEHACFGGGQRFYQHASREIGLPMRFSVFLPAQAAQGPVPAQMFLAGLICTDEIFMVKAGAQRLAFAPVCAPSQCPWGEKSFTGYLGADRTTWAAHDATALMAAQTKAPSPAGSLINLGLADKFLPTQLHPEILEAACTPIAPQVRRMDNLG